MLDLARTIRFAIPTVVARALPVWDLSPRARADGETSPRLEYFEYRYPRREVVLTCAAPMAHFILRELRGLAERAELDAEHTLAVAATLAVASAEHAIAATHDAPTSVAPGLL